MKDLNEINFIDSFISYTERLNYLFLSLSKIFSNFSNSFFGYNKQEDVSQFSMDIYKKEFFDKLENKLFNILNEFLIKEERNGNLKYSQKIIKITEIISDMDIDKPMIIKSNEKSIVWKGTPKEPLKYQTKWFELYKASLIKFIEEKSKKDIKIYSGQDYINIEFKYIKKEIKR